jgi:hypothetical protein
VKRKKPKSSASRLDPAARLSWICLALSVAITFYWLIWGFARPLPEPVVPNPAMLAVRPAVPSAPTPEAVAAITARPLFVPGRQQDYAFNDMQSAPVDTGLSDARLTGIASEADGGIAIVSHGGKQTRVRQGEDLDGWTLERIQDNVARFMRGNEMYDLPLTRQPGQTPPGGGGAPQAPPYPYMPSGMNAPPGANVPGGMQPFPPNGMPNPGMEPGQDAYPDASQQGMPPPQPQQMPPQQMPQPQS